MTRNTEVPQGFGQVIATENRANAFISRVATQEGSSIPYPGKSVAAGVQPASSGTAFKPSPRKLAERAAERLADAALPPWITYKVAKMALARNEKTMARKEK